MPRVEHIGLATLYLGDCREIMPTLAPESVTLLWTDPPYGHGNHDGDFNARLNAHRGLEDQPIANDDAESMRAVVDDVLRRPSLRYVATAAAAAAAAAAAVLARVGMVWAPRSRGWQSGWTGMDFRSSIR